MLLVPENFELDGEENNLGVTQLGVKTDSFHQGNVLLVSKRIGRLASCIVL